MTLGDIIEKILGIFGVEPRKARKFRKRVTAIMVKIKVMEDGLLDVRKRVYGLEERIADHRRELKMEKSEHAQAILMDQIDLLEKEFGRLRDLSNVKGENVDAARALRTKLEVLLENAVNGSDPAELESVLERVEAMDGDLTDVRKLMSELDRPSGASAARKSVKSEKRAKEDHAARLARMRGEADPKAKSTAAKEDKLTATPETAVDPAEETVAPEGQAVVAR